MSPWIKDLDYSELITFCSPSAGQGQNNPALHHAGGNHHNRSTLKHVNMVSVIRFSWRQKNSKVGSRGPEFRITRPLILRFVNWTIYAGNLRVSLSGSVSDIETQGVSLS